MYNYMRYYYLKEERLVHEGINALNKIFLIFAHIYINHYYTKISMINLVFLLQTFS